LLHPRPLQKQKAYHWRIFTPANNQTIWPLQWWIIAPAFSRVFPGDVIVTIMGTIGRSAVIPDDIPIAINTKHLAAITLDRTITNPLFLSYSIHSSPYIINQFKSKNRGAIMSGLNLGIIKETKIRRPPIELQNKFAAIHERINGIKSQYQQSLTELEALYGALSQKAFKGELDLSRVSLPNPAQESSASRMPDASFISVQQQETAPIVLPDVADPLSLIDAVGRKDVITQWIEAYFDQLGGNADFSLERFMSAVNWKLQGVEFEQEGEEALVGVAADYDHIKGWVFAALASGKLTQNFDDELNCIKLRRATSIDGD
jgi:type I restriction enzyme S subunit